MNNLLNEFNNMSKLPVFEISYEDMGIVNDDEYEVYNINADINGLNTLGINGLISIEWDETFSLDEHIQELHELCCNDMN